MATKLDLLLDFGGGQGVGLGAYTNYPGDHDINYGAIQSTVNTMIDELNAARLADAQIPLDLLLKDEDVAFNNTGRFSPWEARVTRPSSASLVVSSGRILSNGRRIDVTGQTFSSTRADGLWYIACDDTGLLSATLTPNSSTIDIASATISSNTWTTPNTDLLAPDTQRVPLMSANVVNRFYSRTAFDGSPVGNNAPCFQCVDADGNLEDGGFTYGGASSSMDWISQNDGGEGTGSQVTAATWADVGQHLLYEQARVIATGTAVAAGVSNAFTALNLDTADRREPASYITNPFFTPTGNTLTVPSGGQYDGTYLVTGYVHFPTGSTTGPYNADIFANSTVVARGGIGKPGAAVDGTLNLSGMIDLSAGDTIQIRAGTGAVGAENVNCRLSIMLIGGPATVI